MNSISAISRKLRDSNNGKLPLFTLSYSETRLARKLVDRRPDRFVLDHYALWTRESYEIHRFAAHSAA